jgi:polar amino acid transport system substrate-binding protein
MLFISFFSLARISHAEEKVYKIASDSTYAPFEFQDKDKTYTGIDMDLIQAIAKSQNITIEVSNPGFQAAVDKLSSGQADGVIAGMSITDERQKSFDFSDPYYSANITIATKENNQEIKSYTDLKGKTIGVKNGTISQQWLKNNQDKYGYQIKTFDTGDLMYEALKINAIQGAMDDEPVINYAINQGQALKAILPRVKTGDYGFAVKKGHNIKLLQAFNAGLKALKASGEYDEIIEKYIGSSKKAIAKKASYKIASDLTFAPFEFQNKNHQYVGIDVDLLNAISKQQGFKLETSFIGFQAAIDQVQASQADAMMAGMSITDERKKSFDFSEPYFTANATLAVKESNKDIKSYADLKGKRVGVKNGTASFDFLKKVQKKYGYKLKIFDAADTMYESLNSGSVAAIMDDEPVIKYAIVQGKSFKTPIKPEKIGEYGFAVKKGSNPELIEMFNNGLSAIKANGQYKKIITNYLGKDQSDKNNTVDETTFTGIISNNWQQLLHGLGYTLLLTLISFGLALIFGTIIGLFSVSDTKILKWFATIFVDIIRGIPLMVLAFFIFYGIPNLLQSLLGHESPLNDFTAGVIALTLNASAYIAEIVRGGINAVPVGQMEAARSLGLPYGKAMRQIILPQAFKIMIPSFVNQFIISLKDTTIISAIGLIELLQSSKIIVARNLQSFKVYFIVAIIYLFVITILTKISKIIERRVS